MSVSKDPHTVDAETKRAPKRSTPNHQPKSLQVHQEAKKWDDTNQELRNIGEMSIGPTILKLFISWLPANSNTFLFELVVVIYLIIAVIHFSLTGDTLMHIALLPYVAANKGLNEVKLLFSKRKKENNNRQPPEDR